MNWERVLLIIKFMAPILVMGSLVAMAQDSTSPKEMTRFSILTELKIREMTSPEGEKQQYVSVRIKNSVDKKQSISPMMVGLLDNDNFSCKQESIGKCVKISYLKNSHHWDSDKEYIQYSYQLLDCIPCQKEEEGRETLLLTGP